MKTTTHTAQINALRGAIQSRQLVSLEYLGRPRLLAPLCIGINSAGHEAFTAYDLSEGSPVLKMFLTDSLFGEVRVLVRPHNHSADPEWLGLRYRQIVEMIE